MAEPNKICNPDVCEFRFEAIEKTLDKMATVNEQGAEQIQTIARAVDKIQITYEQLATTLERLESKTDSIPVPIVKDESNEKLWKLVDKIITVLIVLAGIAAGINMNMPPTP